MNPRTEALLPTGEAAALLHVHPNTLRRWTIQGIVPCFRIGPRRERRFKVDDIERLKKLAETQKPHTHQWVRLGSLALISVCAGCNTVTMRGEEWRAK